MSASSPGEIFGCSDGWRYSGHQKAIQTRPMRPVTTKAACQPQVRASQGTTAGATMAPTLVPALKMPVANARSFLGNHSATVLMAAGKLPDSPMPRAKRAKAKPVTLAASACAAAASDQTIR